MIRKILPHKFKVRIKILQRRINDHKAGTKFAQAVQTEQLFNYLIATTQIIRQSEFHENKIENIRIGCKYVEDILIDSGETFSFWKTIGDPSPERGFKVGRNLIAGKLQSDYGGGLCQLAGIIYITALKSGLAITERYNHSVDIYEEHERFTPLGADASVVYGFKDLRMLNPHPFAVRFRFRIENNQLHCRLQSTNPIEERHIEFICRRNNNLAYVDTLSNNLLLSTSTYSKHTISTH